MSGTSADDFGRFVIVDPPAISVFPDHDKAVSGVLPLKEFIDNGKTLFGTAFNILDGAGRPNSTGDSKPTNRRRPSAEFNRIAGPDASACADCHNRPSQGGAGGFAATTFVGAHFSDPPTLSIDLARTNERNTITVFGSGAIEMIAREMSEDLRNSYKEAAIRAETQQIEVVLKLRTKGVDFGQITVRPDGTYGTESIDGVDPDLVVKPFGVKGVAVSLREFSNFALNQHHGIQSEERFGWTRTGTRDFDGDGVNNEFTIGQLSALTLYQASLPLPIRAAYTTPSVEQLSKLGETRFHDIGCTRCHIPSLPLKSAWFLEPNPFNRPGSLVPRDVSGQIAMPFNFKTNAAYKKDSTGNTRIMAYTDLKRHTICDNEDPYFCNEKIRQDFVPTEKFLTAKLWDVGTARMYGHQGRLTTVSEAIYHHSGEAKKEKKSYLALPKEDQRSIVMFLKSLRVESE